MIVPTADGRDLIVLAAGLDTGDPDGRDEPPHLLRIAAETGELKTWEMPSPFDRMTLSADGRFAVAYFSTGSQQGGLLRNPNEIALVDLQAPAGKGNPRVHSVRASGTVPSGVTFSPPLCIPAAQECAEPRVLVVVLASGSLTFLDATHADRREASVLLQAPGAEPLDPREVLFAPDDAVVFARATGTSDIFVVTLQPVTPEGPDGNDFRPAINPLTAGQRPSDIAFYDEQGARKVLAVTPGSLSVGVIDVATSALVTVPVGDPVDHALVFPPEAPAAALLFARSVRLDRLFFLDLADLETKRGANLIRVDLPETATDVELVPGSKRALVLHDAQRTVISVIDLDARTVYPLQGSLGLTDYAFAADGRYLVAVAAAVPHIEIVDLDTLHPAEVRIDDPAESLLVLPSGAILADHRRAWGMLTVLPGPLAGRDDARVLQGFLFEQLLEVRLGGPKMGEP